MILIQFPTTSKYQPLNPIKFCVLADLYFKKLKEKVQPHQKSENSPQSFGFTYLLNMEFNTKTNVLCFFGWFFAMELNYA